MGRGSGSRPTRQKHPSPHHIPPLRERQRPRNQPASEVDAPILNVSHAADGIVGFAPAVTRAGVCGGVVEVGGVVHRISGRTMKMRKMAS